ncbi:DNA topoisomerase 3 [Hallella mizrahii]|uniref:DNA topoisomerase n=1 Tax=Hallella mizrahii TaxID=2606637 RepID=A0A7K0KB02_9BACT|nr:DNA topoisomerase 3 [Hallella mizrahii]MST83091.1 DNA topoisomerase III [Hallella mizrahii]
MIVCIAEKPSVAKDIARILGANVPKNGYMEGNGYQVTWTFGHLCELKEPNDYQVNWRYWTLAALPMIPLRFGIKLIPEETIKRQFAVIADLYSKADEIVNCGDAGQEGELIQRWVMQLAGVKCPVKRLWISSMTDEAIREGFQNLKEQKDYESLYMAGLSRAIGDWLLGMNCTRLYTCMYGRNHQVLSIGRVQTPTLALIVNRQKEIDNFKPEPYWVLSTLYRDTLFTATAGKYTSKEEGEQAFSLIQDKPFVVTDVQKKQGKEAPRQLYDLTSLQVDCNRKFSFSAEMTLNLIQALYEKKLTTYPRVDTQYLSDDIYPKCPGILNGVSQMTKAGQKPYLQIIKDLAAVSKKLPKSKRVFDTSKVTDHHAIIPTGQVPSGLSDAEMKVYDLIARRFIAVFYPDCKFATTTVKGKVDKVEFKTSGKEILSPGWRAVYAKDELVQTAEDSKSTDEEKTLPTFVKGESGPHKPTLTEKMTQPPKHYTEASLLRAMETAGKFVDDDELRAAMKENGIGRPSSRASIIETLFKRHYIRRERKNLVATPTGIQLIDTIHEKLLTSCELTGIWEKKLRDIEHHKYSPQLFIDGLKEQVTKIVQDVLHDNSNRQIESGEPEPAPKPSGPKKGGAGSARQSTKRSAASRKKATSSASAAAFAASPSSAPVLTKGKLKVGDPCPKCHQGHIIQGKTALGCSRWREGCDFRQLL